MKDWKGRVTRCIEVRSQSFSWSMQHNFHITQGTQEDLWRQRSGVCPARDYPKHEPLVGTLAFQLEEHGQARSPPP